MVGKGIPSWDPLSRDSSGSGALIWTSKGTQYLFLNLETHSGVLRRPFRLPIYKKKKEGREENLPTEKQRMKNEEEEKRSRLLKKKGHQFKESDDS